MKIGILTFQRTTNYGATYQCYALQKYIKNRGYEVEVIDYVNETLKSRYSLNVFQQLNPKKVIKKILNYNNNKQLVKKFNEFNTKNIKLSKKRYDENSIKETSSIYDRFIVGSDQVWNLKLSGDDYNYFLQFEENNKKKNSYAASFGKKNIEEKNIDRILEEMRKFNNISVRENDAYKFLKQHKINKIEQNIDPVFLLDKYDWSEICSSNKKIDEKYILVYEISYTPRLIQYARWLAKEKNMKAIFVSGSNKKVKGFKNINNLSPNEFLYCLNNAEYVVTSSFHGTALSIILNKKFFVDIPEQKESTASRIVSLLELFELKGQMIRNNLKNRVNEEIDYNTINMKILKEKQKAEDYIKLILEENDEEI